MRTIVLLFGMGLVLSLSAPAQDLPKFDVFGGYSLVHFDQHQPNGGTKTTSNFQGGDGAVAFYTSNSFGIVADIGDYKISNIKQGGATINTSGNVVSYLFGPRFRGGSNRVTAFGQVLLGGVHHGVLNDTTPGDCAPSPTPCKISNSEEAFAGAAEVGFDISVAKHFAIRGQGGYLMTRFTQGNNNGSKSTGTQNDMRVSVGIVIH